MKLTSFFKNSIQKVSRNVFGALALTGLFMGGALSAAADSPSFTDIPGDYPAISVGKQGGSMDGSVTAAKGEYVNVLVWVHNTVPNTTAYNTKVKVEIPTASANSHTLKATISADNATSETGTAVINVGSASRISYVSGQSLLMKNVNGQMTQVNWPADVNPDTVVTTGVNLGSVQGCWQYVQAVILRVKVEGVTPAINTNKKVGLTGSGSFGDTTVAQPNDAVEFRVFLQNTGDGTGVNPRITDTLDPHLKYIPNSSFMIVKRNNQDVRVNLDDNLIKFEGNKITWGFADMAPIPEAAMYLHFQARVADASAFTAGTTTHIPNMAISSFDGISQNTNTVNIDVTREVEPVVNFMIVKNVTNLTLGDSKWYNGDNLASAAPGDKVGFQLKITNTGNTTANNVLIKDLLPSGLSYLGEMKLYNKDNPNGVAVSGDAIVRDGYTISSITAGTLGAHVITFSAKVTESCTANATIKNIAKVFYAGQEKDQDYAQLLVSCNRSLVIRKDIKDVDGQYKDSISSVKEGQVITYRIIVQNNGNTLIENPILWDVLPAQTTYVNNSLAIDGEFMSADIQAGFLNPNQGIRLTSLKPGLGKTITFQVRVEDCPPFGDIPLVNTAYVKADGIATLSDTASTVVRVTKPIL